MPAGPEPSTTRTTDLPDYPAFRRRLIADCLRLGAPVPDDRLIQAEHEHRQRELDADKAAEAAWNATHREGAGQP
jgi:hypothetical protein